MLDFDSITIYMESCKQPVNSTGPSLRLVSPVTIVFVGGCQVDYLMGKFHGL